MMRCQARRHLGFKTIWAIETGRDRPGVPARIVLRIMSSQGHRVSRTAAAPGRPTTHQKRFEQLTMVAASENLHRLITEGK